MTDVVIASAARTAIGVFSGGLSSLAASELEFAVRRGAWKLMLDSDLVPRELYNLDDDPMEFFNLIESEAAVAERLTFAARAQLKSIQDDPLRPDVTLGYVK